MRLFRTLALILLAALAMPAAPVGAFQLPGLQRDASNYLVELRRRFPAGGSPQQRAQAEQRAQNAERARDWAGAAAAWEERIGMGQVTAEHWMALGRAQMNRTPPEATRALQAGWFAFSLVGAGPAEVPSLLLMAEALRRLDRPVQMIEALEAVVEREPDEPRHRQQLAAARRAAGMLVRSVATEPDAEPARACLTFTVAPARRTDWQPGDWIRADPPIPNLAVERDGDALCVAGLPWGRSTRLILRSGLPGEDRMALRQDTPVTIAMPNRQARIAFDTRAFILPRGQEARVSVATVNVNTLHLRVMRVTERNLVAIRRTWTPGEAMGYWTADDIPEELGRQVWEGRAEVPRFEANRTQRTAIPLPEALRGFGPGMFVLVARQGDGGAGTGGDERAMAVLPIIATDLGLIAWRGADGLAVQVRGLGDARPKPGVRVALMARNNDVLAEATTDDAGLARFGAPLLRGRSGLAPVAVHAEAGDDLAALSLEAASFDLSDRGATGRPHPGPLDAFVWLDRGIFRPGETVNIAALLRDGGGAPADVPVRIRVKRPNGQVFAEAVPQRQGGASITWPLRLSANAQFGQWSIELLTDPDAPPIGTAQFRVDAFVPRRLDVQIGQVPPQLVPGRPFEVPVTARFLYGAPGAGLSGNAELRLRPDPEPFERWRGWRFGVATETFEPDLQTYEMEETDDQGRTTLSINLGQAPDTTRPLRADISVSITEPGGRESRARFEAPVRPRGNLVAVRPAFSDDAINEGTEAAFDIAAVSPEGDAVPATLRMRLVRERPNWRIVVRGSIARYETVWRDEPVDAQEVRVAPQQPIRFARTLPFGRYRLEVTDANGLGITSIRFRSGWAGVDAAEMPDRVDVSADRRAYRGGETARIRIQPPFAGMASVAVLTDRLVSIREVAVSADGAEVEVPVDAAWGPGAYVAVTVFRPGEVRQGSPGRGLGLAWIGLDPAARQLAVTIESPERIRPRQRIALPVRVAGAQGPVRLTLAAVDEGILRLTNFVSPDPVPHYTGRRRLGIDIRDDYGRLIAPAEGELAALRQGGDEAGVPAGFQPPQRVVSLFSGVVETDASGAATVTFDIPDFAGELRLMAVAWETNRIGAASRPMTVRDEVVAEALLPRFLAPGDEARLPVLIHNVELPAGEVVAELRTEGPLEIAGPARLTANLQTGARAQPVTALRATGSGEGVIRLAVTGPNNFRVEREARITIRSSRSTLTEIASAEIAPGTEIPLSPPIARFVPGTWRATASFGAAVRYDPAAMLRAVEFFPLACTEQVGSRALALSSAMDETGGDARAERLQRAVDAILDRQRYDGAFGLWSAQGEAEQWLTAFATEVLIRARNAGATVPEGALREALRFLEEAAEDASEDTPDGRAVQAYRLHALALAGQVRLGAARRLMERLNDMPTQLSRAQLGAVFARGGDRARAEQAFAAALAATGRRYWSLDFGTAARDALATALLLKESGLLPDRLTALLATLPGPEFRPQVTSTQEQGWAVAAAVALGQNMRALRVGLGDRTLESRGVALASLAGNATARNLGDAPVFSAVSITGVPTQPMPAERAGLRLRRQFFALDGQPLDLSRLRQGQSFILLIEAQSETGESHQAMIQQGLPAGWEIADRLGPGDVPNMQWLGTLTETVAQPALDDRYAAAVELTQGQSFARLAVRIRAVTAGRFELPGGEVADMYRPAIHARQNTVRVAVLPAD